MPSTPAALRHRQITSLIETGETLSVARLAERFGVTTETVRRDLKLLERDGSVRRVFGGAVPICDSSPPLEERETREAGGKRAIARLVAPLIEPHMIVYLGSGSTVLATARELAGGPRLRVMTHMPKIAEVMGAGGRHEVTLVGGIYSYEHGAVMDTSVVAAVEHRNFDVAIIGVRGIDRWSGVTDSAEYNFYLKRKLKERSRRCLFLATHDKFGRSNTFRTLSLHEIDVLVTNRRPHADDLSRLDDAGVTVLWPDGEAANRNDTPVTGKTER